ncbi:unnamed protein product, partial [Trichogramma brassicae]
TKLKFNRVIINENVARACTEESLSLLIENHANSIEYTKNNLIKARAPHIYIRHSKARPPPCDTRQNNLAQGITKMSGEKRLATLLLIIQICIIVLTGVLVTYGPDTRPDSSRSRSAQGTAWSPGVILMHSVTLRFEPDSAFKSASWYTLTVAQGTAWSPGAILMHSFQKRLLIHIVGSSGDCMVAWCYPYALGCRRRRQHIRPRVRGLLWSGGELRVWPKRQAQVTGARARGIVLPVRYIRYDRRQAAVYQRRCSAIVRRSRGRWRTAQPTEARCRCLHSDFACTNLCVHAKFCTSCINPLSLKLVY